MRAGKRLIIMRHAKSSWKDLSSGDHGRCLNARGRASAPAVAACLQRVGWAPDEVWSSDATRTRETWERMETVFESRPRVEFSRELYLAGLGDVQRLSSQFHPSAATVLLLGHNPGWESMVADLTGQHLALKTADAVLAESDETDWESAICAEGQWKFVEIIRSRPLTT